MALHDDRRFPAVARLRRIARQPRARVKDLPILRPHGRTDPRWFSRYAAFPDPAKLFVRPDLQVFRMPVSQGVRLADMGAVPFAACTLGRITVWQAMRSIWPFHGAGIAVMLLVTHVPAISLWLPAQVR